MSRPNSERRGRAHVALAVSAILGASMAACAGVSREPAQRPQVQAALDAIRKQGSLPGITAAIAYQGRVQEYASGYADTQSRLPMPPDAVMPAGSVGKQFFAMTALALAHDGRVDLDVTIDRWFAGDAWFERLPNAHSLTLRMLLGHRGGVDDHRRTPQFAAALQQAFARDPFDPEFRIAPETLIAMVLDRPPLFAPGAGFQYSETGYILAGLALERACRCSYYAELERRFLRPLDLSHTRPATTRAMPGLVNGYVDAKLRTLVPAFPAETTKHGELRFSPATEWTGGGLYSNVSDLVRWSTALYEERAMRAPYLNELLARDPRAPVDEDSYGLGVRIMHTAGGVAYGHAGEFPGYLTFVAYFPVRHASIALQTNTGASNPAFLRDAALQLLEIAGAATVAR